MGMNWLFNPLTDLPSRLGKKASEHFSPANEEGNMFRGFMSGASEGAGDLVSSMTSPIGIASSLAGMPWMKGLARGAGAIGTGMKALNRVDNAIPQGINPSMLPPGMIARGAEGAYNAGRGVAPAAKTVEDLAYEIVRRGRDPINKQIGNSYNLAEAMKRSNAMR